MMNFSMFNDAALFWVIVVIVFGFLGWSTYKTIRLLRDNKKNIASFKSQHPHAELLDGSKKSLALMLALALACIVLLFLSGPVINTSKDQLVWVRVAYIALAWYFVGQGVEMTVRKKLWFSKEGFFYLDKFYRFRMITAYERQKGTVPTIKIKIGSDEVVLPQNMAVSVNEHEQAWKAAKKASKKKNRG